MSHRKITWHYHRAANSSMEQVWADWETGRRQPGTRGRSSSWCVPTVNDKMGFAQEVFMGRRRGRKVTKCTHRHCPLADKKAKLDWARPAFPDRTRTRVYRWQMESTGSVHVQGAVCGHHSGRRGGQSSPCLPLSFPAAWHTLVHGAV